MAEWERKVKKDLVTCIAEEYWKPIIEPASPEERAMMEERIKDYEKDSSSFIPLSSIKWSCVFRAKPSLELTKFINNLKGVSQANSRDAQGFFGG
jgi:hypothetical protein